MFVSSLYLKKAQYFSFSANQNVKNVVSNRAKSTGATLPHHPFHLVDPSPWPAFTSMCMLWLTLGLVLYFHKYSAGGTVLLTALVRLVYTASLWWRDVFRESLDGCHTSKVKDGLHLGMILFIVSEAMFFVGLLWAFLHASLMPTVQIGMAWPPVGIVPVDWTRRPTLNTVLLAASYFTANAAKHALDKGDKSSCRNMLILTIFLGAFFSFYQYLEYGGAAFTFSDSVFGSAFYLSTGFHGMHVIIGFLYLAVCLFTLKQTFPGRSTALDLAILYWHFVDIVWVFVFALVYVWGGALPTAGVDTCADGLCVMRTVLRDARLDRFYADPTFFETAM
uniref:Cytochrome c oxidase subunit 3 n=1 Tax=Chlorotetraedron incus TaxID=162317 RepID=A0A076VFZ8_9CHLO|nr:cytochrome c oxidase subunit 3 [Chlorotetraedron incus]AIK29120.1 cytochrome c oxidase subunit 3 [Chlorotetraedron incus]